MLLRLVEVVFVGLQDIHPPVGDKRMPVAAAYEAVIGAVAEKEAKILAAEGYRAETLPRAVADSARKLNEAHAAATRKTAIAAGQAGQFTNQLAAYLAAPTVFRQRSYLEAFTKAVAPARKLVIGPTNTHDVIILNLEEKFTQGLADGVVIQDPDKKK